MYECECNVMYVPWCPLSIIIIIFSYCMHIDHDCTSYKHVFITAAVLLPFGVAAGDELLPSDDVTSHPVSLSCRFYGVEEDTVYVRN